VAPAFGVKDWSCPDTGTAELNDSSCGETSTDAGLASAGGGAAAFGLGLSLNGLLVDVVVDAEEGAEVVYTACDICGVVGRRGRGELTPELSSSAWDFFFSETS
jgi:hypothetical protein